MSTLVADLLRFAVVLALGAVAVLAGSPVVQSVFRAVDRTSQRSQDVIEADAPVERASLEPSAPSVETIEPGPVSVEDATRRTLRGGLWIGRLERTSIYAGILAGWPEAIAICLAMKGLARYSELKAPSPGAAEGFVIGTFTSVLWACANAGLAHWVIGLW